jgi:PAS domain-containing protein
MAAAQKAIELILARNFLSSLSTPAFLVDRPGEIVFYNESACSLLGRRFEETGPIPAEEWLDTFGPFDADGAPIPIEEQPLTHALRANRPGHARHVIRSVSGGETDVEVSGFPIVGVDGFQGAVVLFWPVGEKAE